LRFAITILGSLSLFAGPRGPVEDKAPPAAAFRGRLDVLLIDVLSDDGDISATVIRRVFRGHEHTGPLAVQWDIVQSDPPSIGDEAHAGDRLIVTGTMAANRFFVRDAYRASADAEMDLAENVSPRERIKALQDASFYFLLVVPLWQFWLHHLGKRDRRFVKVNLVLPLVALLDYCYYESGDHNPFIRLDLLLLYPIGAIIVLFWILFAVKPLNRDAPRPELH
jgi:hypothetical protein